MSDKAKVGFHVSRQKKLAIQANARKRGMSVSAYILDCIRLANMIRTKDVYIRDDNGQLVKIMIL